MKEYVEEFGCWDDVRREFSDSSYYHKQQGCYEIDPEKEPNHVYAYYDCSNYEGDAVVAFYKNKKFYLVSGGHCSCMGLEGQWEPEEYTPATFKRMLDQLTGDWGVSKHKAKLLELIEATKGK